MKWGGVGWGGVLSRFRIKFLRLWVRNIIFIEILINFFDMSFIFKILDSGELVGSAGGAKVLMPLEIFSFLFYHTFYNEERKKERVKESGRLELFEMDALTRLHMSAHTPPNFMCHVSVGRPQVGHSRDELRRLDVHP